MAEKRIVKIIPANKTIASSKNGLEVKKLKVAAYCRVSTDSEEQATSYDAQVEYYTNYINNRNDWEFAGIFADDGISGTNTKKRLEFNRMIDSCIAGNINMIITKSISRFARNTLDCLKYIRKLKEYNVPVYFEKENINTMDSKGEVLLTIMASLAQQESESISKNVKMGIQYRYQKGEVRVNHNRFLGYTKDEDGKLVIQSDEAEVVKRIFKEYLEGKSLNAIAKGLMVDDILTAANKPIWRGEAIRKILSNEKYMGDALLQKTYTVDVLNKKRVVNNGLVPQYYVENSHEGIISKEMFHKVQVELKQRAELRKNKSKQQSTYSSKYLLSNLLVCQKCGNLYRRVNWKSKGSEYTYWRCKTRVKEGKSCCDADSISEKEIQNLIIRAINGLLGNKNTILETLKETVEEIISSKNNDLVKVDKRIHQLEIELEKCIHENKDFTKIIQEMDKLKSIKDKIDIAEHEEEKNKDRIFKIQNFIETQSTLLREYDDEIARKLIRKVVIGDNEVEVIFQTGKSVKMKRFKK
ncbi:recombinase family protein [Aerococcaceae bacterium NML191219]|nr:recombinase family protein [Aerococcaceae bacterium NML191219]